MAAADTEQTLRARSSNACELCGASTTFFSNAMFSILPRSSPFTGLPVTFSTVACTVTSAESVRGNGRAVVTYGSFTTTGPVADRYTFCQMPVSRSGIVGSQSHPMVERNVGPSMALMPPLGPMPVRNVCTWGAPG